MGDQSDSLIIREEAQDAQLFLFLKGEIPKVDRQAPRFNYTGERLFERRQDVYHAVVRLLAEPGVSIREICRVCHVTDNTVQAVAAREKIPIAAQKKVILQTITHGVRLAAERVVEELPKANVRDATIALGVLTEKMQLLSGDATARIETAPAGNVFAQFEQFHQAFVTRASDQAKPIEGREIGSQIGVQGENAEQKALPAAGVAPGSEAAVIADASDRPAAAPGEQPAVSDKQTEDQAKPSQGELGLAANLVTESAAEQAPAAAAAPGGGGGACARPTPSNQDR